MIGRQGLFLEYIQGCPCNPAAAQRIHQVVQSGGFAAAYINEEGGGLHQPEARRVHQPFGFRRVGDGQDDEVSARQLLVERLRRMHLGHTFGQVAAPGVDADHSHAEGSAQSGGFGTDPPDTDDQRRRLRKVDDSSVQWIRSPLMPHLEREVMVQAAGEGEHECHDVRGDMLVEDAPEIGHDHRVLDELREVEPGRRRNRRRLKPLQLPR